MYIRVDLDIDRCGSQCYFMIEELGYIIFTYFTHYILYDE